MRAKLNTSSLSAIALAAAVVAGTSFLSSSAHAAAPSCGQMPSVAWWGNPSPESTIAYVKRKHSGDWSSYLAKWTKYETRMSNVLNRGKTAVVRSNGTHLKGAELADYISKIAAKISIIKCLAGFVDDVKPAKLNALDTAAGADLSGEAALTREAPQLFASRPKAIQIPTQTFTISNDRLNLKITTLCKAGEAIFIVRNQDQKGRTPGNFSLYSDDESQVLSSRRMWLGPGQSVRFSLDARHVENSEGRAWLRIEPVAARAEHFDASVSCSTRV